MAEYISKKVSEKEIVEACHEYQNLLMMIVQYTQTSEILLNKFKIMAKYVAIK